MKVCDRENREYIGTAISNFDHSIDKENETTLKDTLSYGDYPAWNFHGIVWFEENQFHCEIWRYRSHVETISAKSLEEIMKVACSAYGYE